MKAYLKLFVVAFFSFLVLFAGIYFAVEAFYGKSGTDEGNEADGKSVAEKKVDVEERVEPDLSTLESAIRTSGRINVIAFGLNGHLSDTMMLISFDPFKPSIDILSIPRDTYHYVPGYESPAQKKMNAVYGFGGENGGPEGLRRNLSEFLGVPIDYYVKIDMEAVVGVVDTLGGYEVEVPYDMKYTDNAGGFRVNLKKGHQVLDGEDTLGFLRFRKSDDEKIQEGDVVRIPRHQAFVKAMINQAVGKNLPAVLNTIIGSEYVSTDLSLEETLTYGLKAAALQSDDIRTFTVEGEARNMDGASYWIHDPLKLTETLEKVYHVKGSEEVPETEGQTDGQGDGQSQDSSNNNG